MRVFVPSGTYDISAPLRLRGGESFVGEAGSTLRLNGTGVSLFRVQATPGVVKGITLRKLVLAADSSNRTVGIDLSNFSTSQSGGASDFQIQGVDFNGFAVGIYVHPRRNSSNADPMYDSVSLKDARFNGNRTAIRISSANASNWNLENIGVNIPDGREGVRVNGVGNLSIRGMHCDSPGVGSACVTVQRQNGLAIEGLTAANVTNALMVRWENGWTQYPFTLRNSDLTAGVYFQGRVYLNSVGNTYPADLSNNPSLKVVRFGAEHEGSDGNVAYGGQSDIFSCGDTFKDTSTLQTQSTWAYTGTLSKPVTYCY
jgi:hypothetical protein